MIKTLLMRFIFSEHISNCINKLLNEWMFINLWWFMSVDWVFVNQFSNWLGAFCLAPHLHFLVRLPLQVCVSWSPPWCRIRSCQRPITSKIEATSLEIWQQTTTAVSGSWFIGNPRSSSAILVLSRHLSWPLREFGYWRKWRLEWCVGSWGCCFTRGITRSLGIYGCIKR